MDQVKDFMDEGHTLAEASEEFEVPIANLSKWRKQHAEGALAVSRVQKKKTTKATLDPLSYFGTDVAKVEAEVLRRAKKSREKKWPLLKKKWLDEKANRKK